MHHIRALWITAAILFIASVGGSIGVNIWYTNSVIDQTRTQVSEQFNHECSALELLTDKPYKPSAKPAEEQIYLFYVALLQWKQGDHC